MILGRFVLAQALGDLRALEQELGVGARPVMSVNLSARQLGDPGLVEAVAAMLAESGVAGSALRLEITETAMVLGLESASRDDRRPAIARRRRRHRRLRHRLLRAGLPQAFRRRRGQDRPIVRCRAWPAGAGRGDHHGRDRLRPRPRSRGDRGGDRDPRPARAAHRSSGATGARATSSADRRRWRRSWRCSKADGLDRRPIPRVVPLLRQPHGRTRDRST